MCSFAADKAWSDEPAFVELAPDLLTDLPSDAEIVFCALDATTGSLTLLKGGDIDQRRSPWSTFKIANLIIALETGVAADLHHRRVWDRDRRPARDYWPRSWQQDQSLATAFKRSAVWYFQDIALEVGTERYRSALRQFRYGNGVVAENSDQFWLGGSLAISPQEQTMFLKQVLDGSLAVSHRTKAALREVSLVKAMGDHALHGKTGFGSLGGDQFEGWFVGWVERQQAPTVTFALYMQASAFRSQRSLRRDLAEMLLRDAGYLPEGWE